MATSNIRKERRRASNSRIVVAEITFTAVFKIPSTVTNEELQNDYLVRLKEYVNPTSKYYDKAEQMILMDTELDSAEHVFVSDKLMVSGLHIEDTYDNK